MEGSFKNKLLKHEVVPPPGLWDNISRQLDKEFTPSDLMLSAKMENAAVMPPFGAWENIAATLKPQPAKVIPLAYRRIAVAAAVLGLIALSAIYFFNGNTPELAVTNNTVTRNQAVAPAPSLQAVVPTDTPDAPPKTLIAANAPKKSNFARSVSSRKGNAIASEPPYLTYAEMEMEPVPVRTVMDLQPVEVEAPPIRDARGKIIMDYSVISRPDDPYITITSPNGTQTRISSKFLHCLSYLNSDFSSFENIEGRQWKNRFEEWRNKLLSEGAFIPAASNFFDIFELKALIEEQ